MLEVMRALEVMRRYFMVSPSSDPNSAEERFGTDPNHPGRAENSLSEMFPLSIKELGQRGRRNTCW